MTSAPPVSRKNTLLIDDDDLIVVSVRRSVERLGIEGGVTFDPASAGTLMLACSRDVAMWIPTSPVASVTTVLFSTSENHRGIDTDLTADSSSHVRSEDSPEKMH